MATAVLSRRERAAAEQIGMLMGIILAIILALAVYFVVLPIFSRAGAAAAISLSASGTAAPDGTSVVMTLVIQNTGSSPAAIYAIQLTPYGAASVAGASPQLIRLQRNHEGSIDRRSNTHRSPSTGRC